MPIYNVAILRKPTVREQENGVEEKLIFGPVVVVAKDQTAAVAKAMVENKDKEPIDMTNVEVLVRNF